MSKAKKKYQVVFPRESRCPRCGGYNTVATATRAKSAVQYRTCRSAICRHNYSVSGKRVAIVAAAAGGGNSQ